MTSQQQDNIAIVNFQSSKLPDGLYHNLLSWPNDAVSRSYNPANLPRWFPRTAASAHPILINTPDHEASMGFGDWVECLPQDLDLFPRWRLERGPGD